MDCKRGQLIGHLRRELDQNPFWAGKLSPATESAFTLHLAVLREPYLRFILEGKKTIETRFAKRRCAPFEQVEKGDVIILKRSPGPLVGVCVVEAAWFYRLDAKSLALIKSKFGPAICPADSSFWEERKEASVATLMLIGQVARISPIETGKKDRRGWVVISEPEQPSLL